MFTKRDYTWNSKNGKWTLTIDESISRLLLLNRDGSGQNPVIYNDWKVGFEYSVPSYVQKAADDYAKSIFLWKNYNGYIEITMPSGRKLEIHPDKCDEFYNLIGAQRSVTMGYFKTFDRILKLA